MMEPMTSESEGRPWRAVALSELWQDLGSAEARPLLVAVDGRSGAGKSTFAARLAAARPGAVVLHTDDIAWHHSFFDWHADLAEHVLRPLRRGEAVDHRPRAWHEKGREGSIRVPAGTPAVVVEGVSASHRRLAGLYDLAIWLETDPGVAHHRVVERDGADELDFIAEWDAAEIPFLADDAPWERADLLVSGEPHLPHDPTSQALVRARHS